MVGAYEPFETVCPHSLKAFSCLQKSPEVDATGKARKHMNDEDSSGLAWKVRESFILFLLSLSASMSLSFLFFFILWLSLSGD